MFTMVLPIVRTYYSAWLSRDRGERLALFMMHHISVRSILETVVESVAVLVTAQDAAEASTTADTVAAGRVTSTKAPSVTTVPQSPPKLPQENLHRSPLGCITNKTTRS